MRIGYVSDLHLEFGLKDGLTLPGGDVLLLVGDIVVVKGLYTVGQHYERAHDRGRNHIFYKLMETEFKKYERVYAIMGNHEHYGADYNDTQRLLKEATVDYPFFRLLENETVDLAPGWKMFATALWTDYNAGHSRAMDAARMGMNDHFMIKNGRRAFSPEDAYKINQYARNKMAGELFESKDKWVLMTHHTPSLESSHKKWGGGMNLLNYAFHNTDFEQVLLDNSNIKYWVHGHTHDPMDYIKGECRVLCNPKGYGNENPAFDPNRHFEVN